VSLIESEYKFLLMLIMNMTLLLYALQLEEYELEAFMIL